MRRSKMDWTYSDDTNSLMDDVMKTCQKDESLFCNCKENKCLQDKPKEITDEEYLYGHGTPTIEIQ